MDKTIDRLNVTTFNDSDSVWIQERRNDIVLDRLDLTTDQARDLHYMLGLVLEEKQEKAKRR